VFFCDICSIDLGRVRTGGEAVKYDLYTALIGY